MPRLSRKFAAITALTVVVIAGGATAAFAYWTATGSGTGVATTSSGVTAIVANQTTTISSLSPDGVVQTISGNFTNSNSSQVYVTSVTASIASVVKAQGAPAGTCDATDYTLLNTVMTIGRQIPPGTNVDTWSGATISFNNKSTNQDACKGATVNLAYAIA